MLRLKYCQYYCPGQYMSEIDCVEPEVESLNVSVRLAQANVISIELLNTIRRLASPVRRMQNIEIESHTNTILNQNQRLSCQRTVDEMLSPQDNEDRLNRSSWPNYTASRMRENERTLSTGRF